MMKPLFPLQVIAWLFCVLMLLGMIGCDSIRVTYADAVYQRTTLFADKTIEGVTISKDQNGDITIELNKADTINRMEALELITAILKAAQ